MAAPNLRNPTTVTYTSFAVTLTGSATVVVNNAASSGTVVEIVSLYVCNDDGTNNADITLALHPQDDGAGTGVELANTITVPADSTLVLIDKDSPIYLEEDESLVATASATLDLNCVGSYRVLS